MAKQEFVICDVCGRKLDTEHYAWIEIGWHGDVYFAEELRDLCIDCWTMAKKAMKEAMKPE